MEWRDEGALLSVRRHGEGGAIIEVLTREHGRHAGVVPGGGSRKMAPVLQPGAQLSLDWRARLSEHLGTFRVEPVRSRAGALMTDRQALAAISAISALLSAFLPERESCPDLYHRTINLLDALGMDENWRQDYARWELMLLSELGYGLDLSACAATGGTQDLIYVSPKSGRAVSRTAGAPYADRMLPLPRFLTMDGPGPDDEVAGALRLTGHFLAAWAAPAVGLQRLPEARARLVELI